MKTAKEWVRNWLHHEQPDLLRIAWLARYELSSAWIDLRGRLSPKQRTLLAELRAARGLKLHIASGPARKPGWINVDGAAEADVQLDLRRALPFASGSVAMIFSEHFLDHLQFPDVVGRFLSECHRILEPGGRIRLVMHDAELLAKAYVTRDEDFFRAAVGNGASRLETMNLIFRFNGFHQFLYDFETVKRVLERAGFETVLRSTPGGSALPELNLDALGPDRTVQSLYVEAIKSPR